MIKPAILVFLMLSVSASAICGTLEQSSIPDDEKIAALEDDIDEANVAVDDARLLISSNREENFK